MPSKIKKKPVSPMVRAPAPKPARERYRVLRLLDPPLGTRTAFVSAADKLKRDQRLLTKLKRRLPTLKALLKEANGFIAYEDAVYRFYHHSFKVYRVQEVTIRIIEALCELAPGAPLNQRFADIVAEGTSKAWDNANNRRWEYETRPMLEAFFHARYFLEMACKYGKELKRAENMLPSGWAALLYLFDWR